MDRDLFHVDFHGAVMTDLDLEARQPRSGFDPGFARDFLRTFGRSSYEAARSQDARSRSASPYIFQHGRAMAAFDAFESPQFRKAHPVGPRLDSREHCYPAAALADKTQGGSFCGTFL
jgi:hypothetical protein